jgi:hypothetical protein
MSIVQTGVIQNITLTDNDINEIYSIDIFLGNSSGILRKAYPLDTNIKRIPLLGEVVLIFSSIGLGTTRQDTDSRLYYMSPLAIHLNPNSNAFPPIIAPIQEESNNQSYEDTSAGNSNVGNVDDEEFDLGEGFDEDENISPLQPFLGDVLIEGRFGHSLRFGYTPNTTETSQRPSWSSNNSSDPITILSNGRGSQGEYNKFVIEDIDDDKSSMWMTSTQKIRLSTSQNNLGTGVQSPAQYDAASIILNSDRLLLNAKSDYILLSADKSVNVATPNWAMDLDSLFTEIKNLIDNVIDLNENVEKAHEEIATVAQSLSTSQVTTQLGPQPLLNFASFISSNTKANVNKAQTQTIKQTIQNILQTINRMEQ